MSQSTKDIFIILILLAAFFYVLRLLPADNDSLLSVEVDEATSCEYLVSSAGGVTPRIDSDYMHMGCTGLQESENDPAA